MSRITTEYIYKPVTHSEMVAKLMKPGSQLMEQLTPKKIALLHMAVGISGESGELLDAIKKYAIYNRQNVAPDWTNLKEELGDLEFYMEGMRQLLGFSRQEILDANMTKLAVRYKDFNYSDKAAEERADKA